jgi:phosphoadenosine phosphosulfate reductase
VPRINTGDTYMDLTLEEKENLALQIIKIELDDTENPFILFNGSVESLVVMHLLRQINGGKISIPVLHIDTSAEFKEIYQYIEKMRKLWRFRLIRERNEEALKIIKFGEDRERCCSMLKITALENAIKKYNIDRLLAVEDGKIKMKTDLFIIQGRNTMVYPIKHFSEEEVWDYVKRHNLPYCSLYDKGYKDIKCTPCTDPVKTKDERFKKGEEIEIKKRLKALGYF